MTEKGAVRFVCNDRYAPVLDTLKRTCDTHVLQILTMFGNGQADLPSYAFRRALLALDMENRETEVLLKNGKAYITRRLADII